ncbi:gliding motility-associated C-terminal domain-containing protein [Algoriphagus sp. H41]|uniref:Gliding motility-associated C-terminal domain-containing protein n=1 Tax=Algoriphagus oliviformis TaxID=2811231 RepID=A0ABS3BXW8_9BACT|nr:T9SS type B sorting domain-containing protein [Algoriphagus oliviformis]MBN7809707.1 gliding motility-associated C-terminal domain-containing protein [Algoriphagus oliviformis]
MENKASHLKILLLSVGLLVQGSAWAQFAFNIPSRENEPVESYSAIYVKVGGKLALNSSSDKGSILLDVAGGVPPYSFRWSSGETSKDRTNLNAGTYTVLITDSEGLEFTQRVEIQPPFSPLLDPAKKGIPAEYGQGLIKGDGECWTDFDYRKLSMGDEVDAAELVVIPAAFSPNGDQFNDTFKPKLLGISSYSMEVVDAWGEVLFHTSSLENEGWDGTYKGQLLPAGNFLYQVTYTTPDGQTVSRKGGIALVR